MLDLVGNPEDRFSHNEAHIILEVVPAFCLLSFCDIMCVLYLLVFVLVN